MKSDRSKASEETGKETKVKIMGMNRKSELGLVDMTTPKSKKGTPKLDLPKQITTPKNNKKTEGLILNKDRKQSASISQCEAPFEDELMSDVTESQDNSIVSHIEVDKLGKNKFDKWDILYQDDE